MASTRRSLPAPKTPRCSSDEDTSDDDEEDSSDEVESSEEDVPSLPPRAKEDSDRDYEESEEDSSQSDSGEAPPKPKKNVPAKTSLKRKAADLAEPSSQPKKPSSSQPKKPSFQPKKAALDAGPSPAPVPAPAGFGQAEQLLEEKSAAYDSLWRAVQALEAKLERPVVLIEPFLRLADDKASALNTKIKKRRLAEMKLQVAREKIRKEVANALIALIH